MKTNKFYWTKMIVLAGIFMISFSCSKAGEKIDQPTESIVLEETGETPALNTYPSDEVESDGVDGFDKSEFEIKKDNIDTHLKIIKNANCRMKVSHVEEATHLAKKIAARYNGYISDERFTNTNYSKENRFTIRIPQNQFDTVLDSICELAEFVDYKNISTVDVTEEYVDISSRLKTKFEIKERYETILRTRVKTVKDILMAEDKLGKLQEEIESAQGRLNYLSNRVAYSTIQLDMYETVIPEDAPPHYEPGFLDKAQDGFSFGWSIIETCTLALFYIWPLLFIGMALFVYLKWIRK